jgi:hypothetical protein
LGSILITGHYTPNVLHNNDYIISITISKIHLPKQDGVKFYPNIYYKKINTKLKELVHNIQEDVEYRNKF